MGIVDRIILSIYTLLLIVFSAGLVLLSFNLLSLDFVWTSLMKIPGQWETALFGLILLGFSIRLLFAGIRTSNLKDTIIHHTEMGDVHVSLAAVENLVEKTARQVRGVRSVKVRVTSISQGVKVYIKAIISPESSIPTVGADIQKKVHDYIKNTVGVELVEIRIFVNNISNEFKVKQRVE